MVVGQLVTPKGPKGWREAVDLDAFKEEIDTLGKTLRESQGAEDVAHLKKILMWSRMCFYIGLITGAYKVNIISIFLISCGIASRWTMIAHHSCHGGYDKQDIYPHHRRVFALGFFRRIIDWLDWMLPEAWNVEHNQYHHYQLGETADPDLVEHNLWYLRQLDIPLFFKYIIVGFFCMTWKWFYYAPNTYKELKLAEARKNGEDYAKKSFEMDKDGRPLMMTVQSVLFGSHVKYAADVFVKVLAPYFIYMFVILPLPFFYLFGRPVYYNVLWTLFFAELMTNIHAFVVIVTNHAGDDMYRFATPVTARSGEFYLRQIIGSVNFATGGDVNDFLHGWLNYQIEHHLWPDLSMLSYQKSQPLVKAMCAKYGIPYIQQSVWWRFKKTIDICVGTASMKQWEVDE